MQRVVILVLVLLIIWYAVARKERMTPFYLDDIAMAYSDPTVLNYTGREKDVLGMSARDYYLENDRNYLNSVAPGYFEGNQAFVNNTGYLDMPAEYRPKTMTKDYKMERFSA